MSLVGSLEDLGLGDILQIIHLSRKSGVLILRSEHGEGHVLFDAGLICGAYLKDGPSELRELLGASGLVDGADLEAAWADARARGVPLAEVLVDRQLAETEALDRVRRVHVESAVIHMFSWAEGEFSFEVRKLEASSEELFLDRGLNPQFLALEGTRQLDESERGGAPEDAIVFDGEADDEAELLAADEPRLLADDEPELLADDEPELLADDEPEVLADGEPELLAETEPDAEEAPLAEPVVSAAPEELFAVAEPSAPAPAPPGAAAAPASGPMPPIVAIDSQLPVLEWVKATLGEHYPRVHIFQTSDLGISRIRQYLARRELPVVLIAADAPADPLSGARDSSEIVTRLRAQASRMPVLVLGERAEPGRGEVSPGFVPKPTPTQLADAREVPARAACADALIEGVARALPGGGPAEATASTPPGSASGPESDAVAQLRRMSERLRDPATPGEVLPLILGFASRSFARVAMFMVIEGRAVGMAGQGLEGAGGPADGPLPDGAFDIEEIGWFRKVVESRSPVRGAPDGEGDRRLADALGAVPEEAYVAPIEIGGQVVALLYGDNLPSGGALPDTQALEVVLHQAGLALDRAVLERALEQSEA